jgi:hypothetical protein
MKKISLFLLVIGVTLSAVAQTPEELKAKKEQLAKIKSDQKAINDSISNLENEIKKLKETLNPWNSGAFTTVNFNQVGLTNWAAGGQDAISVTAMANAFLNYQKGKLSWTNNLDLAYGLINQAGEGFIKNEDKIDLYSKLGWNINKKLNYTAFMNFKSQFAPGFDFNNPDENRPIISRFFAPAWLLTSIGIDWNPTKHFSVYISPAAGKFTFVNDDSIAALNLYIPETHSNPNFRGEFGALISSRYQQDIFKNVRLLTKLDLFNNYTDINKPNRRNIDVNWETNINIKLGKYIGMTVFTHLIYDHDIEIEFDPEGQPGRTSPKVQFKEVFGLGFSYKL